MDESLLTSKGIAPSGTIAGYVDDYALMIGSRATLVQEEGGKAYGLLMNIRPEDVDLLYHETSVADYIAETLTVNVGNGAQVDAVCYNLPNEMLSGVNPKYAATLYRLAKKLEFPKVYLKHIQGFCMH